MTYTLQPLVNPKDLLSTNSTETDTFTALPKFCPNHCFHVCHCDETQHGSIRFVNGMHLMPSCDATVNINFGSKSHLAGFSKDSQNQILSKPLYPEQCYYVIISIKVTNQLHVHTHVKQVSVEVMV
jgi:hypothetical protein